MNLELVQKAAVELEVEEGLGRSVDERPFCHCFLRDVCNIQMGAPEFACSWLIQASVSSPCAYNQSVYFQLPIVNFP